MKSSKIIWQGLVQAGLVEGDEPKIEQDSPWYIKVLLAHSGWFGAFFLILFIGGFLGLSVGNNIENFPLLLTFLGGGLIAFAYTVFKEKQSDFLEHFTLALSVTGQVMVIASFFFLFHDKFDVSLALFTALFQAFLMYLIPNYIHRMLSSFFMALSLSYFFYAIHEPFLYMALLTFTVAWLWIDEFTFASIKKIQAIAYGQTIALIWLKYTFLSSFYYLYGLVNTSTASTPLFGWVAFKLASLLTLVYVVWKILEQNNKLEDRKILLLSFVALALLSLLSLQINGLLLGILFLLLGFAHAHRLLLGLGFISSVGFISSYYYFTGETLLEKAELLFFMGLAILIIRWIAKNILEEKEKNYA